MNSVMQSVPNSPELIPTDFVFHIKNRHLRVQGWTIPGLKEQLSWTFPEAVYNQIDFSGLSSDLSTRHKVYEEYQVVLHPQVLDALPDLSVDQIAQSYQDYLDALPNLSKTLYPESSAPKSDFAPERTGRQSPGYYPKKFAKSLAIFLDKRKSAMDRYAGLMDLEGEFFFIRTGIGFILQLLPRDLQSLEELVHLNLVIDSKDGDKVRKSFGNQPVADIYNRLLTIQTLVEDGSLDLRLEGESLIDALDCHK